MSTFDYAYQSLASTGQKVTKRPRIVISVILGTIVLLGAIHLLLSSIGRPYITQEQQTPVNTAHGLADFGDLHNVPPTRYLHMTEEQCIVAFPELYKEADRAQEYFTGKGGISKKDVDAAEEDGNARVVILNNTVSRSVFSFPAAPLIIDACLSFSSRRSEEGSTPGRRPPWQRSIEPWYPRSSHCRMWSMYLVMPARVCRF